MNLTIFLKQIEQLTAACNKEQLAAFIYDTGRTLPEQEREKFLERLKSRNNPKASRPDSQREPETSTGLEEQCEQLLDELNKIYEEDLNLVAVLNEEYDDWYDNGEEFYYQDPHNICCRIEKACNFVHRCVDEEAYLQGMQIGNYLYFMQIFAENEYYDTDELELEDLIQNELVFYDLRQLALDTLYCSYHALPLPKRTESLYETMKRNLKYGATLEALMQHGDKELPEWHPFLKAWIAYLGTQVGKAADFLLAEAIGLLNDLPTECSYAEQYMDKHPDLYLQILEAESSTDAADLVKIGLTAIQSIPKKYSVRSAVALKTAGYGLNANAEPDLLAQCYFAAYESDTNVTNYLRALLHGFDSVEKRDQLKHVIVGLAPETRNRNGNYNDTDMHLEKKENHPSGTTTAALYFFEGQFAEVLSKQLNAKEALGWSGTFMKQGIALFLLYLYAGNWNGKGIQAMAKIAKERIGFSMQNYQKGIPKLEVEDEAALFENIMLRWKEMTPMDPETKSLAIPKIENLLEKRVSGIMDANRRNYYGECASFLAALGEVKESLGEAYAKQNLMTSYKEKYPRRTSFRAEMKAFGWIDRKK